MQSIPNLANLSALGIKGAGSASLQSLLTNTVNTNGGAYWAFQETSGSVSLAVNPALALGRDILLEGTFPNNPGAWTLGDGWTIAGNTASSDGSQLAESFLSQDLVSSNAFNGTFEVTFTITNRSAGQIEIRLGGDNSKRGTARVSDGTFVETLSWSATGTTANIIASDDFIGEITNVTVKQTNILASTAFPGSELLDDGDMEAGDTSAWTVSDSTLSKQTTNPHGGTRLLRVTATAQAGARVPQAVQSFLTVGKRYRMTGWARSDGTEIPQAFLGGSTGFTGTNSTDWQPFDFEIVAAAVAISLFFNKTDPGGTEYAEFDDVTVTEANPLNGDTTGATINQSAGSKLKKSYSFDKTNDFVDVYSAEINSIFDPTKGTLLAFAKVSGAGVWTDGSDRKIATIGVNTSTDFLFIGKTSSNNELEFRYEALNISEQIKITKSPTDYFMVAMTWDVSGNLIAYFNGIQSGTTPAIAGTMLGNLGSTTTVIGSINTTPAQVFDGFETHIVLLTEVLSATELLQIARRGGTA